MNDDINAVEATRARFRPDQITTLFVGESARASGDFFYLGNTAMKRHMQRAVERALGEAGAFLERFKAYGWYLDDLVPTPVNRLEPPKHIAKCLEAQSSLAHRIAPVDEQVYTITLRWFAAGVIVLMLGLITETMSFWLLSKARRCIALLMGTR
jgi:hypothetical protein